MKKIIFLLPLLVALSACTKEAAEKLECKTQNVGYVTITNTSKNPYKILIDNSYKFELAGNTFKDDIKLKVGEHNFEADQVSGFVLYPTVKKTTIWVWQCDKKSWVIP